MSSPGNSNCRRSDVTLSDWALNVDLNDSLFAIAFPAGTLVNNQVLGRSYRTRVVDDTTIARAAREAENLRNSFERSKNEPLPPLAYAIPPWIWAVASGLAAAAAIVSVLLIRKKFLPRLREHA